MPPRNAPPTGLSIIGFLIALAFGGWALSGCATDTRVVHDGWDDMHDFADKFNQQAGTSRSSDKDAPKDTGSVADRGYAILLDSFGDDNRHRRAKELVDRLTRELGVQGIWVKETNGVVLVLRGQYGDPETDAAMEDLHEMRMLEVDGLKPYGNVDLVSLAVSAGGGAPAKSQAGVAGNPLDLTRYKGKYTLMVAGYDGPDCRKNAEKAAAVFREKGDDAYFLHGPKVSVVTVGLFGEDDFAADQSYGPRIKALQKKYPYYLYNGRTEILYQNGKRTGENPSQLIHVD